MIIIPELALSFYYQEGYPVPSVMEYLMTLLNSNFEEWRRANPDASMNDFPFSPKKMSVSGSLFDMEKLRDVSKNVISRMTAEEVYDYVSAWSADNDPEFHDLFVRDPEMTKKFLAIGRGGKKPRKDLALWSEVRGYMGFFFDELFTVEDAYPEQFAPAVIRAALEAFLASYDPADEQSVWFDKIKAVADSLGFASDMKAYRAAPEQYPGSVADISMFLRIAVTGKQNSPDMYEVMRVLGADRVRARIGAMIARLA